MFKQAKAIGLNISLDEAQVLIQTAKPTDNKGQAQLSKEEYAQLLFSQNEDLNVDLKVLKPVELDQFPAATGSGRSNFPTEMSDFPAPKTIYDDDYVVLDQKKVP